MTRPFALLVASVLGLILTLSPGRALAQDGSTWVQVGALSDRVEAGDLALAFSSLFPETAGYELRSGWFAVVLGPYPEVEAQIRLDSLVRDGLIPPESFLAYSSDFDPAFWPLEAAGTQAPELAPEAEIPLADTTAPDETEAEARAREALLDESQRKDLQTALQWFGHYSGAIDGAYGPGTRKSMAAWQEAAALDPTGTLTTQQRVRLMAEYTTEIAAFGFQTVTEPKAGITATLPLGLVEFDHYEPPFVHYRARGDSGLRLVLISQPGDALALAGLYDLMQSLEAVPLTGERSLSEDGFRIQGQSADYSTTIAASLTGGLTKGWMLISTPGNDRRDARIVQTIEAGFQTDSAIALDPGQVAMDAATRDGLMAGLDLRKPRLGRSGFFVDAAGSVLTTVEAVEGCARITIDQGAEATVLLSDAASGLALLAPTSPLSPMGVAELQPAPRRGGSEIAVAGYPYEDRLPAPVLSFGTLEEVTGLQGEPGLLRLSLMAQAGDVGGPVLDATVAVVGMLLPAPADPAQSLPAEVRFALATSEITRLIAPLGIEPLTATRGSALNPTLLGDKGRALTVLVSCWD